MDITQILIVMCLVMIGIVVMMRWEHANLDRRLKELEGKTSQKSDAKS